MILLALILLALVPVAWRLWYEIRKWRRFEAVRLAILQEHEHEVMLRELAGRRLPAPARVPLIDSDPPEAA